MSRRITILTLSALTAFGLLGGVAGAQPEDQPKCPDQKVGTTIHEAEEPFAGTPAADAAELVLHQTAEPLACSLPLP